MKKKHLTLKIFIVLIMIDVLETLAQYCFKKGVANVENFQIKALGDLAHFIMQIAPSPFLWLGMIVVMVIFATWSTILSKVDLSVAVPVCSFSYISIPLVSSVFLHEKISPLRWTGIVVILLSVVLVSISSKHKAKPNEP